MPSPALLVARTAVAAALRPEAAVAVAALPRVARTQRAAAIVAEAAAIAATVAVATAIVAEATATATARAAPAARRSAGRLAVLGALARQHGAPRQADLAAAGLDVDDHDLDLVADLEHILDVLDAALG